MVVIYSDGGVIGLACSDWHDDDSYYWWGAGGNSWKTMEMVLIVIVEMVNSSIYIGTELTGCSGDGQYNYNDEGDTCGI